MSDLFLNVEFEIKKKDFEHDTNIKEGKVKDIVCEFLRGQIGEGEDNSPANNHDIYKININLDLNGDVFTVKSNCGNLGLRDGILMVFQNTL